jgi:lysophospholipase L1-like esterase
MIYQRKTGNADLAKTHYFLKSANGGTSKRVLDYLIYMYEKPDFKPDILLVNAGLHDLAIPDKTQTHRVAIDDYEKNVESVINLAKKHNTTLVWIRTTPVNDEIHNSRAEGFQRHNADVIAYNAVADRLCKKHNIPEIDLYQFTLNLNEDLYPDHVHFNKPVRKLQAAYIAGRLTAFTQ